MGFCSTDLVASGILEAFDLSRSDSTLSNACVIWPTRSASLDTGVTPFRRKHCMCTCIYTYMYICIYICKQKLIGLCVWCVCMLTHSASLDTGVSPLAENTVYIYMFICMYVHKCMYDPYVYICIYIYTFLCYVCMLTRLACLDTGVTSFRTKKCVYTFIYVHIHYTYTYMYI